MSVITAGSAPTTSIIQSAIDKARTVDFNEITRAAWDQDLDLKKVLDVQSPCKSDNSNMKGIQRVIKNMQNDIERIKKFSNVNSAFDALTNENVEPWVSIKKVINFSATDIAGYVKNIMGGVRGWVLNTIQNEAKKVLPFLFPGEMPSFIDALGKGTNILSCAFANIVRGLTKMVGDLLLQMIDKFINGPMCLAESIINNLLNQILGPIEAAIGSALALINGFLSAIGGALSAIQGIAGQLFNMLDFMTGILNFFKCDDDKACPSVQEISLSGAGQNNPQGGDPVAPNSTTQNASPSDEGASQSGDYTAGVSQANANAAQDVRVSSAADPGIDQALADSKANIPPGKNDLTLY
jgi:hypothetical protein